MENLTPCHRTTPGCRMAEDSRPRRKMEDGLQRRAQGKGPGTWHGLSQPRAVRRIPRLATYPLDPIPRLYLRPRARRSPLARHRNSPQQDAVEPRVEFLAG